MGTYLYVQRSRRGRVDRRAPAGERAAIERAKLPSADPGLGRPGEAQRELGRGEVSALGAAEAGGGRPAGRPRGAREGQRRQGFVSDPRTDVAPGGPGPPCAFKMSMFNVSCNSH